MDYDKAMEFASRQVQSLNDAFGAVGFEKSDMKTTRFDVSAGYKNVKDKYGNYHREFNGYVISHNLKLAFDFTMEALSQALTAIASFPSNPELSIAFTVKDATTINEEMLRSATVNARKKAEILCKSSGVKLGQLLSIDYNWGELDIFSHTQYDMNEELMSPSTCCKSMDIEPDDIDVSDTATFVWEIL